MKQFWDDRYKNKEYAYGIQPNDFLKASLVPRKPGRLLLPAEGEGRNATFAASLGWDVEAFDYSVEGQKKAHVLAERNQVKFTYRLEAFNSFVPAIKSYDLIALVYAHADPETRHTFNRKIVDWLSPGGEIILEGFSKDQLGRSSGGPKNPEVLLSIEELKADFKSLQIEYLEELEVTLREGLYHQGGASVIRLIARKPL